MNGSVDRNGVLEIVIDVPSVETIERITISLAGGSLSNNNDSESESTTHNSSDNNGRNTRLKVKVGYRPNAFIAKVLQNQGLLKCKGENKNNMREKIVSPKTNPLPEKEEFDNEEKENEQQTRDLENDEGEKRENVLKTTEKGDEEIKGKKANKSFEEKTLCQLFPDCSSSCPFMHPKCEYKRACIIRNCRYSHPPPRRFPPVPPDELPPYRPLPGLCKYYPQCKNAACRFLHEKICHYGKNCRKSCCKYYHDPSWTLSPGLFGLYRQSIYVLRHPKKFDDPDDHLDEYVNRWPL